MERLYNVKIIKSRDRLEIYKYQGYIREGRTGNNKLGCRGKGQITDEEKIINRREVLYKARNNIIRLIASNNDMKTFITLTYKENMQDLRLSKVHINYMFKKLSKEYKYLKYLYVLELQERGAIHYHFLCNIPLNYSTTDKRKSTTQKEFEKSFAKKYWSNRGFVDIRNIDSEGISNVAKYVAAYLVEDLLDININDSRIYGYSKNLNKPLVEKIDSRYKNNDILEQFTDYKITYANQYQIHYTDKLGQDKESQVYYYDMFKE